MQGLKTTLLLIVAAALIAITGVAAAEAEAPPVRDGRLALSDWTPAQSSAVSLSGNWRFVPDRLVTPRELLAQQPALSRQAITLEVPAAWNNSVTSPPWPRTGHGTGTYWLTFEGPPPAAPLGLVLHRACSNADIRFFSASPGNAATPIVTTHTSLGRVANSPAQSVPHAGSKTVPLVFSQARVHHLLIQSSNFDFRSGGLCGDITLGTLDYLDHHTAADTVTQSMLIAMIGVAGIYLLALYSQNVHSMRVLWLMTLCLSACAFFFAASGLLEKIIASESEWLYRLRITMTYLGLIWASASIPLFYASQFPLYVSRAALRTLVWLNVLSSVAVLITPTYLVTAVSLGFIGFWALELALGVYILVRAALDQRAYTRPMLAAIVPLALAVSHDVYGHTVLNDIPLLSLICLVFFIFIHSLIVGRKFAVAINVAENLSNNLQREVTIRTAELHDKNRKLEQTQRDLQEANNALKKLSITDGLTRLHNRMYFEQEFRKEWRRSARLRKSLSILMIDVDHFKQLNDSAGHLAGDQALQTIAKSLHHQFKRAGELAARYGGEEFIVMLPDTDQRKALAVAEGFRAAIEKQVIQYDDKHYRVTVSVGISTTTPSMRLSPEHLLAAADSALYQAKDAGRNRIEIIPLLPRSPQQRGQQGLPL